MGHELTELQETVLRVALKNRLDLEARGAQGRDFRDAEIFRTHFGYAYQAWGQKLLVETGPAQPIPSPEAEHGTRYLTREEVGDECFDAARRAVSETLRQMVVLGLIEWQKIDSPEGGYQINVRKLTDAGVTAAQRLFGKSP